MQREPTAERTHAPDVSTRPAADAAEPGDGQARAPVLGLQRSHGNRFVSSLLAAPRGAIQRRFFLTGTAGTARALLDLIGPAAGLTLSRDAATRRVTEAARADAPPSAALRTQLTTIMDDANQHAEVHVGRGIEDVMVGAYPGQVPKPAGAAALARPQVIDMDQILALQGGMQHAGVVFAIHEIWENYVGHGADQAYEPAHRSAIETESDVAEQLIGAGRRVAGATDGDIFAFDYDRYYVMFEVAEQDNVKTIERARRAGRTAVATHRIDGFADGSAAVPAGGAATIAAAAAALLAASPLATVRVSGYAAAAEAGDGVALGALRAGAVMAALAGAANAPPAEEDAGDEPAADAAAAPAAVAEVAAEPAAVEAAAEPAAQVAAAVAAEPPAEAAAAVAEPAAEAAAEPPAEIAAAAEPAAQVAAEPAADGAPAAAEADGDGGDDDAPAAAEVDDDDGPNQAERMHAVGRGAVDFVAANDTDADRARNRRVVIEIERPDPDWTAQPPPAAPAAADDGGAAADAGAAAAD